MLDAKDKVLLNLLKSNCRETTADLARKLGVSRSTVTDRMTKLEKAGVITGYTIRLSDEFERGLIKAHVMIRSSPKSGGIVIPRLRAEPRISALYTVNGLYDLLAIVEVESTAVLDEVLDLIGEVDGIEKTLSTIVLSTKFER